MELVDEDPKIIPDVSHRGVHGPHHGENVILYHLRDRAAKGDDIAWRAVFDRLVSFATTHRLELEDGTEYHRADLVLDLVL